MTHNFDRLLEGNALIGHHRRRFTRIYIQRQPWLGFDEKGRPQGYDSVPDQYYVEVYLLAPAGRRYARTPVARFEELSARQAERVLDSFAHVDPRCGICNDTPNSPVHDTVEECTEKMNESLDGRRGRLYCDRPTDHHTYEPTESDED